jgi:hypothetical protein
MAFSKDSSKEDMADGSGRRNRGSPQGERRVALSTDAGDKLAKSEKGRNSHNPLFYSCSYAPGMATNAWCRSMTTALAPARNAIWELFRDGTTSLIYVLWCFWAKPPIFQVGEKHIARRIRPGPREDLLGLQSYREVSQSRHGIVQSACHIAGRQTTGINPTTFQSAYADIEIEYASLVFILVPWKLSPWMEPSSTASPGDDQRRPVLQDRSQSEPNLSQIVIPPYWQQHRRHASYASIASNPGATAITLEDHTEEPEGSEGVKSPLWAKLVSIDSYVIVSGSVKGVGDYVVWICKVETLDVRLPFSLSFGPSTRHLAPFPVPAFEKFAGFLWKSI